MFLKIWQNLQENTCAKVAFSIKLLYLFLLKKILWHRCFPANFAKFLRIIFFIEHLRWCLLFVKMCLQKWCSENFKLFKLNSSIKCCQAIRNVTYIYITSVIFLSWILSAVVTSQWYNLPGELYKIQIKNAVMKPFFYLNWRHVWVWNFTENRLHRNFFMNFVNNTSTSINTSHCILKYKKRLRSLFPGSLFLGANYIRSS